MEILWYSILYPTFIEVKPVSDIKMHFLGDECWCNPRVKKYPGGEPDTIITHNAKVLENEHR